MESRDLREVRELFDKLDRKLDRITDRIVDRLGRLRAGQGILSDNQRVLQEQARMNAQEALARIRNNTSLLTSISTAADLLEEGQANVAAKIAELKAQIEAGQTPDFTEIEAALTEQETVIGGLAESIPANVEPPVEPVDEGAIERTL